MCLFHHGMLMEIHNSKMANTCPWHLARGKSKRETLHRRIIQELQIAKSKFFLWVTNNDTNIKFSKLMPAKIEVGFFFSLKKSPLLRQIWDHCNKQAKFHRCSLAKVHLRTTEYYSIIFYNQTLATKQSGNKIRGK